MHMIELLFAGIQPASRRRLDAECRRTAFRPLEDILRWGDKPARLHQVVTGHAKVWRPGVDGGAVVLFFLYPDDVAGLMATCRDVPGVATITAADAVGTVSWPAALVRELIGTDARMAGNALRIVARRAELLAARVEDLTAVRADQQLARALLRLAGEDGSWSALHEATVPVTRQDLADMTRSTLHTASRTLSGWEAQRLVHSRRGQVTITDSAGLAQIAGLPELEPT